MNELKKVKEKIVKDYLKEITEKAEINTQIIIKKLENKPIKDE